MAAIIIDQTRPDQTRPDQTVTHDQKSHQRKALLVTLFSYAIEGNYGNALQLYATQEIVKKLGYYVDCLETGATVDTFYKTAKFLETNFNRVVKFILAAVGVKKYRKMLAKKARNIALHVASRIHKHSHASNDSRTREIGMKRYALFRAFYTKYIDRIIHTTYREALTSSKSRWNEYDYVIAGSDQIWNMGLVKSIDGLKYYYLMFAEQDKRVNYASSFGVSKLKLWERPFHKKGLRGFRKLSCREKEGCNIIRKLTGREAELVLDPTLLITAEQWRKIARKPEYYVPEHYALCYFWDNNKEYNKVIAELSAGIEIIQANNIWGESNAMTGPCEFLWLVDHADYVFTGSFHGTAFAVNFEKKFVSFNAVSSVFSRIETLLDVIGLQERIYTPQREFVDHEINYAEVEKKLNIMREKSMSYLKDCLK